jgi:hypothetical protein
MSHSLHDLTRAYIAIDDRLRDTLMEKNNRRQLEVFRDEIAEEIVMLVRVQTDEVYDASARFGTW